MKQKFRFLLLLLAAIVLAQTATAAATEVNDGTLMYDAFDGANPYAKVKGYVGDKPTGELIIPADVTAGDITYKVTGIQDGTKTTGAFVDCTGITSVVLPEGMTRIGNYAFYMCQGLKSVTIPESVKAIGANSFYACKVLESVVLPSKLESIGAYAFNNCFAIASLDIPASVTTIGNNAFNNCNKLADVTLNWDAASVVAPATSVIISKLPITIHVPEGCADAYAAWAAFGTIEEQSSTPTTPTTPPASAGTEGLKYAPNEDGTTASVIGWGTRPAGELVIPATIDIEGVTYDVTAIDNGASGASTSPFGVCQGLTSVVLPEGLETIGKYTFQQCIKIASVNLPSTLTKIDNNAFYKCLALTTLDIPSSVTTFGASPFGACDGLTEVTLNWDADNVPAAGTVFGARTNLTINIPAGTVDAYTAKGWNKFGTLVGGDPLPAEVILTYSIDAETGETAVTGYDRTGDTPSGELVIPATVEIEGVTYNVTSIADASSKEAGAFWNCQGITSISFPENFKYIGKFAFQECKGLTSVVIPEGVTNIATNAFQQCIKLATVELPSSLGNIGTNAFIKTAIESIDIPASVAKIGEKAFNSSTKLAEVYVHWTDAIPAVNADMFAGIVSPATLYIPARTTSAYEATDWATIFTLVEVAANDLVVASGESVTLNDGDAYDAITIAAGGEVNAEGKDITIGALYIEKEFTYSADKANGQWFSLALPFAGVANSTLVEKFEEGAYVPAICGVDYVTFNYNGASRAANGLSAAGDNWDMLDAEGSVLGELIQFAETGTHKYRFAAPSAAEAVAALKTGRVGSTYFEDIANDDNQGWNLVPAGKTYSTIDYSICSGLESIQIYNSVTGAFDTKKISEVTSLQPGTAFAVQLQTEYISNTRSSEDAAAATVDYYSFELIAADGTVLDRIYLYDGSNDGKYRLAKMSALNSSAAQMAIKVDGKNYCTYSTLASDSDKQYSISLANANGATLVMKSAGAEAVTVGETAAAIDSPISVEDGEIVIKIGSATTGVDSVSSAIQVTGANGYIAINGAAEGTEYAIATVSGITTYGVTAAATTSIEKPAGVYVVKIANKATKVIVK